MYLQTLKTIVDNCGPSACYVQSVAYHASQHLSKSFHPAKFIEVFKTCQLKKYISSEGWVNSLFKVATEFGFDVKYVKKAPANYVAKENELEIQKWYWSPRPGKVYTHFVAAKQGIKIFDPMGDSNVCKNGHLHSKRIIGL